MKKIITLLSILIVSVNAYTQVFKDNIPPPASPGSLNTYDVEPPETYKPTPILGEYANDTGRSKKKRNKAHSDKTRQQFRDEEDSAWQEFINRPASQETKTAPKYFNWEATNADRFINSPCYKELGFNPFADPQIQESRYRDCENEKRKTTIRNIAIIGFVVCSTIAIIYYGYKNIREKNRKV